MKFHEYGGEAFLLHVVSDDRETVVWHEGGFATISIAHTPWPEHFEVSRETDPAAMPAGVHMEDALAAACALLATDLETPQSPKPQRRELRLHMLKYVEQL